MGENMWSFDVRDPEEFLVTEIEARGSKRGAASLWFLRVRGLTPLSLWVPCSAENKNPLPIFYDCRSGLSAAEVAET